MNTIIFSILVFMLLCTTTYFFVRRNVERQRRQRAEAIVEWVKKHLSTVEAPNPDGEGKSTQQINLSRWLALQGAAKKVRSNDTKIWLVVFDDDPKRIDTWM